MIRFFLLFGFVLLVMVTCTSNKQECNIYHNNDFDEIATIANDANLPFCVVLIDSTRFTADEYINMIKVYKTLSVRTIYNFINVRLSENKWYSKLLSPQIYPVTCVFNTTGQLIDLVPGNSKESMLYIDKAINTGQPCLEFHYNQKYDQDKIEIIHYINSAVELKSKIYESEDVVAKIDSLLHVKEHPYLLYLKLQKQVLFNKKTEARKTAEELLSFDSVQDLLDYYDELLIANQLLDSTYNTKTAPLISSISNNIELPNCKINHTYNLNIEIINEGKKPLKISDILTSCSCVELKSDKKHIVNSRQSLILKAVFTPDVIGNVSRKVYIASNSLNTPIYTISINANVE